MASNIRITDHQTGETLHCCERRAKHFKKQAAEAAEQRRKARG